MVEISYDGSGFRADKVWVSDEESLVAFLLDRETGAACRDGPRVPYDATRESCRQSILRRAAEAKKEYNSSRLVPQ